MMKEKLGFYQILKEALTIPYKNPNFIIFTFLTSLPLFYFMLITETLFQQTLIQSAKILQGALFRDCHFCSFYETSLGDIGRWIEKVSHNLLLLGVMHVGIIHFLDLFNTVAIVDSASLIYVGEKNKSLKDMLCRLIKESRFAGPLITSIYALLLASLILLGLAALATHMYIASMINVLFMGLFGVLFVALLTKYLDWNAIWNLGIVISVLEEKQGDVALVLSAYLSRDSRVSGLLLMLVFFVWSFTLRSLCFYVRWHEGGSGSAVTAMLISMVCLGNVIKWMVFVVYSYHCKKRSSEKKIESNDVEECRAVEE